MNSNLVFVNNVNKSPSCCLLTFDIIISFVRICSYLLVALGVLSSWRWWNPKTVADEERVRSAWIINEFERRIERVLAYFHAWAFLTACLIDPHWSVTDIFSARYNNMTWFHSSCLPILSELIFNSTFIHSILIQRRHRGAKNEA